MGLGKNWTQEDIDYLCDKWGSISLKTIARNLDRTENAILVKKQRLGLGAFLESGEYVTWNQLLIAIGINSTGYKEISWIENREFPIKTKRVNNNSFKVVYLEDFWEWANDNRCMIDFSRFEENALGIEPDWVKEKRKHDYELSRKYIKTPWTSSEDSRLEYLVNLHKYSYVEVSKLMRRTEGAIQRRCADLKLKARPLREHPHSIWEDWQLEKLKEILTCGCSSYEFMSEQIPKSTKAIRGKVCRLFGTENLDKVRIIINKGKKGAKQ